MQVGTKYVWLKVLSWERERERDCYVNRCVGARNVIIWHENTMMCPVLFLVITYSTGSKQLGGDGLQFVTVVFHLHKTPAT